MLTVKVAVCCNNSVFGQACLILQAVYVLCEAAQQQALVMQQLEEEVCRSGHKGSWKQFLHLSTMCDEGRTCCSRPLPCISLVKQYAKTGACVLTVALNTRCKYLPTNVACKNLPTPIAGKNLSTAVTCSYLQPVCAHIMRVARFSTSSAAGSWHTAAMCEQLYCGHTHTHIHTSAREQLLGFNGLLMQA